jgi:L-lactate dehydrogenase complex protein LldG
MDAAIISTAGGIAETEALTLLPDEQEPRLMSLVPPVHIEGLKAAKLLDPLAEAMRKRLGRNNAPTSFSSRTFKTAELN